MDNKIFNVNGLSFEMLQKTLELLFANDGHTFSAKDKLNTAAGWYVNPQKGLVLVWSCSSDKHKPFMTPMTAAQVTPMVWEWLKTEEAKKIPLEGYDMDSQHDGSNECGWRVYVESWGHVQDAAHSIDHYSMCAIKPAYMWYGK